MNPAKYFLAVAAFVLTFCAAPALAQTTARILVGFPPGGALDALARVFAEKLAEAIGRPVLVENRAGASGQIAAVALKASTPDGNTLMVVPDSAITLYPHTVRKPAYDTLNDFVPIAHIGSYDSGLAVGPNVPAGDLKEWLSWVKADKKNAIYGSPGPGSNQQFLGFMLAQATGVQLAHVAYKGVGPAINELLGGHVPALMLPLAQIVPLAKSGKIRLLGQSGGQRAQAAPEVPTFKELGYPTLEVSGWYLLIAPAGIRPDIVARYNEIFAQAMRTQGVRDRMRALDLDIREMAPAEIAAKIKLEHERWRPIVKASGFSADN